MDEALKAKAQVSEPNLQLLDSLSSQLRELIPSKPKVQEEPIVSIDPSEICFPVTPIHMNSRMMRSLRSNDFVQRCTKLDDTRIVSKSIYYSSLDYFSKNAIAPVEFTYKFDSSGKIREKAPGLLPNNRLHTDVVCYCASVLNALRTLKGQPPSRFKEVYRSILASTFSQSLLNMSITHLLRICSISKFTYSEYAILHFYVILLHIIRNTKYSLTFKRDLIDSLLLCFDSTHVDVPASSEGVVSTIWDAIKKIGSIATSGIETVLHAIGDAIHTAVVESMQWIAGFVIPGFNLIRSFIDFIVSVFVKIFSPISKLLVWVDDNVEELTEHFMSYVYAEKATNTAVRVSKVGLYCVLAVLAFWFAAQLGIVSYSFVKRMYTHCVGLTSVSPNASHICYSIPEGPIDPVSATLTLAATVLCGTGALKSQVFQSLLSNLRCIVSVSDTFDKVLSSIVSLLPCCISSLIYRSKGQQEAFQSDLCDFLSRARIAMLFASTPAANSSDEYASMMAGLLTTGHSLVERKNTEKINTTSFSTDYNQLYIVLSQLSTICANIIQIRKTSEGRPEPVWLHLFGAAGAGKSFFMSNLGHLFHDLPRFDGSVIQSPDVYNVPVVSAFWNGFQQDAYPICCFDEIWEVLENNKNTQIDYPNILLTIMSTVAFMPNLPALTSGVSGQKGTTFNSTLFTTAHNNAIPTSWTGNAEALARRMKYVYEIRCPTLSNPADYYYYENYKDFAELTPEQIKNHINAKVMRIAIISKETPAGVTNQLPEAGLYRILEGADPKKLEPIHYEKIPLTMDIYKSCWTFQRYNVTVNNNQLSHKKLGEPVSLDQLIADVRSTIDVNVNSFLQQCNANSLSATLNLNQAYNSLLEAVIKKRDVSEVYKNLTTKFSEQVRESVPPELCLEPAVVNEVVEAAKADAILVERALDPEFVEPEEEKFAPDFVGENNYVVPADPKANKIIPAEALDEDAAVNNIEDSRAAVAAALGRAVFDLKTKLPSDSHQLTGLKRVLSRLISVIPKEARHSTPVKVTNLDPKTYVTGDEFNSAFQEHFGPMFKQILSDDNVTGKVLTSVVPDRVCVTFDEYFHEKFQYNPSILHSYLNPMFPYHPDTLAEYVKDKDYVNSPLFVLYNPKNQKEYCVVDRHGQLVALEHLCVPSQSRFQRSNNSIVYCSPKNSIAFELFYWNFVNPVNVPDPYKPNDIAVCTSIEHKCYTRSAYPSILGVAVQSLTSDSPVPSGHCYCSHCLRVFDSISQANQSVCVASICSKSHSIKYLSKSAAALYMNVAASIPIADYVYRCAMFWICAARARSVFSSFTPKDLVVTCEDLQFIADHCDLSYSDLLVNADVQKSSLVIRLDDGILERAMSELPLSPYMYLKPNTEEIYNIVKTSKTNINNFSQYTWIYWAAIGFGVVAAVTALVHRYRRNKTAEDPDLVDWVPESAPVSKTKASNGPTVSSNLIKASELPKINAPAAEQAAVTVTTADLCVDGAIIHGFMPRERYFVSYSHAFVNLIPKKPQSCHLIVHAKREMSYNLNFMDELVPTTTLDMSNDVSVTLLPARVQCVPDRTSCFVDEVDLPFVFGNRVCLKRGSSMSFAVAKQVHNLFYTSMYEDQEIQYRHGNAISYPIPTEPGDCGSVLTAVSGPAMNKVVGMHVAHVVGSDVGASIQLTREYILALLDCANPTVAAESQAPTMEAVSGPNIVSVSVVEPYERVNMPTRTSYVPSHFTPPPAPYTAKEPAIMSRDDPRSQGQDPLFLALSELGSIDPPPIDSVTLQAVRHEQLRKLVDTVEFPLGIGELTIEQAVCGVPNYLSSIRTTTSAGYPLCQSAILRGKKSFVRIVDGAPVFDPVFEQQFLDVLTLLRNGDRSVFSKYPFRWLAYEKDELRPKSKIDACKTRIIYCNSLLYTLAFRVLFGRLLAAFNNNPGNSIFATGINVNSYDMDLLYQQLGRVSTTNLIVGDYSGFDKHYHPDFQLAAYENMYELMIANGWNVPRSTWDLFVEHELCPYVQAQDKLIQVKHSHFSGCFFTTPENCIVNELYFMYCFKRLCPNHDWCEECEMVCLGDDHIVAVSDNCPAFNMLSVCEAMKELGQVYTDANKNVPSQPYFTFEESTFLGSSPVRIEGRYVGALRLDTLYGNLSYFTRKCDPIALCDAFLDLCSIHPEEVFDSYYHYVSDNLSTLFSCKIVRDYLGRRYRQCNRTADSSESFIFCYAEGPMNTLVTQNDKSATNVPMVQAAVHSTSTPPTSFATGLDSFMKLLEGNWTSSQTVGTNLFTLQIPGECLTSNILQSVPFCYNRYWKGDVEIAVQINGTPFMQGGAALIFLPLADELYDCAFENCITGEHLLLQPLNNNTALMRIPYRYFTDMMETGKIFSKESSLGKIELKVVSPLQSSQAVSAPFTVWVRFPDSEFHDPRKPLTLAQAQGRTVSQLVGKLPFGETLLNGMKVVNCIADEVNGLLNYRFIHLNHTPVIGGSNPYIPTFQGISNTENEYNTASFSLTNTVFYAKSREIFSPCETKIAWLLSRECLIAQPVWSTSTAVGTSLFNCYCSSILNYSESANSVPMNIAVLNCFMYWHADIVFTIHMFKTRFHSGRLRVTLNYYDNVRVNGNYVYSQILDASEDKSVYEVRIPWSYVKEYMNTLRGSFEEGLGRLDIEVLNPLVSASASVSDVVNMLIGARFENARVAVPVPVPRWGVGGDGFSYTGATTATAEGPEVEETDSAATIPIAEEVAESIEGPLSMFPEVVEDVLQVARRLRPVLRTDTSLINSATQESQFSTKRFDRSIQLNAGNFPFSHLYAACSGSHHLRILGQGSYYSFIPGQVVDFPWANNKLFDVLPIYSGTQPFVPNAASFMGYFETGYPTTYAGQSCFYADLTCPYQVPWNFVPPVSNTYFYGPSPHIGKLLIANFTSAEKPLAGIYLQGAGDDFLYGLYVPPASCGLYKSNTTTGGLGTVSFSY